MKIIYLHRTQGEEPESIHIMEIVNSLRSLGHEVLIVGPSKKELSSAGSNTKLMSHIKKVLPKFAFEIAQMAYNFLSYRNISGAIKSFRPDFIYERYALYSISGVYASGRYNIPHVLEVNTPYAHAWSKYYKLYFPSLAKNIESKILSNTDHVLTVTNVQKEFLLEQYPGIKNIAVTQNAINLSEFNLDAEDENINWCVSNPVVIGFVGTMNRWQGMPVLLDVVPNILKRYPSAVFLLVGDGEFRAPLESKISELGFTDRVKFSGRVAHRQIPGLVNEMDITILPDSNTYGSPMKIFEYMAMKKAVIAPDVPPVREVMEHAKTGLIIKRSSSEDLVASIGQLIEDKSLRQGLSEAGYKYVTENHTWKENALKIIKAYHLVMEDVK